MTSIMMIPEEEAAGKVKAIMHEDGKLDSLTRDIIALTVSVMNGCDYCISVYTAAVQNLGMDDEAILELMSVVVLFSGLNKFNSGLQVEPDGKPWFG
jgi:AhpD family alkylhydroperoxidase